MKGSALAAGAAVAASLVFGASAGHADNYWEVEAARANARAGGPVSARDAELLERYGCLTGSRSSFCERLSQRDKPVRRAERRKRARN